MDNKIQSSSKTTKRFKLCNIGQSCPHFTDFPSSAKVHTNYEVQKISLFMIAEHPLHCGTNLRSEERQSIEHKSWLSCIERVLSIVWMTPAPIMVFFKSKWIFMIDFVTHSNSDGWYGVLPFLYHHFFIIKWTKSRNWTENNAHMHTRDWSLNCLPYFKINRKLNWQTNWLLCSVMTVKSLISSSSSHGHWRRQQRQKQQQSTNNNNNNNR